MQRTIIKRTVCMHACMYVIFVYLYICISVFLLWFKCVYVRLHLFQCVLVCFFSLRNNANVKVWYCVFHNAEKCNLKTVMLELSILFACMFECLLVCMQLKMFACTFVFTSHAFCVFVHVHVCMNVCALDCARMDACMY